MQTCNADGSGYSECACPGAGGAGGSAGSGGGSNAGAAGSGGADGEPLFEATLRAIGAPCASDADCPQGPNGETPLVCLTSTSTDFGTGGPQGGYCSAPCTASTDCQALDGLAICGLQDAPGGDGYCIGLCQPGEAEGLVKCFGVEDEGVRPQACFAFPQQPDVGACFPVCQNDAGCGAGRFCDLGAGTGLGLCVDAAPAGVGDIGAPCTGPTAEADCKSGTCVTLLDQETGGAGPSFCSAVCTFGLVSGCGFAGDEAVGARDAACLFPQEGDGGGLDVGFCAELCDTNADCEQAANGWTCALDLGTELATRLGRAGECVPPGFGDGADAGVVVDAGN